MVDGICHRQSVEDEPETVTVEARTLVGAFLETVTSNLPAYGKTVSMSGSFFAKILPAKIIIRVQSTGNVTGFALFFAPENRQIVAVPAAEN